jgi:AraC family transcriptional regulator
LNTSEEKAIRLLEECPQITVASINEARYPRACVVSRLRSEALQDIYFSTEARSNKVAHFRQNPKASVSYYHGGNSVSLTGMVEIVTDRAMKAAVWQDWLIDHFSGGVDDPNYCLLRFQTEHAGGWIDQEYVEIFYTR